MAVRNASLILALSLAGCLPDLGGYAIGDGGPRPDGGTSPTDGGGVDAGPAPGGPCGRPTLFAAVQDVGAPPGRVLRWQLRGAEPPLRCADLTATGALAQLPYALAPI